MCITFRLHSAMHMHHRAYQLKWWLIMTDNQEVKRNTVNNYSFIEAAHLNPKGKKRSKKKKVYNHPLNRL